MSIDFNLFLGGSTPIEQLAGRVVPSDRLHLVNGNPNLLSANLDEKFGFAVDVLASRNGYVDISTDDAEEEEWEPEDYRLVGFQVSKSADFKWAVTNMMAVIQRVLATGNEDAAFNFNGDVLILTRFDGVLVKHNREKWWSYYPGAEQLFPG